MTKITPFSPTSRDKSALRLRMFDKGYSVCETFGCRHVVKPPLQPDRLFDPRPSFCAKHQLPKSCQLNLICDTFVRGGLLYANSGSPHHLDLCQLVIASFQQMTPVELAQDSEPDVVILLTLDQPSPNQTNWVRVEFAANQQLYLEQTMAELDLQEVTYFTEDDALTIPTRRSGLEQEPTAFAEVIATWLGQQRLQAVRKVVGSLLIPADRTIQVVATFYPPDLLKSEVNHATRD